MMYLYMQMLLYRCFVKQQLNNEETVHKDRYCIRILRRVQMIKMIITNCCTLPYFLEFFIFCLVSFGNSFSLVWTYIITAVHVYMDVLIIMLNAHL